MMGGDAGADRTGRRPDSLSVLSVDAKTGKTAIISVPRNLQNAQFSEGSPMRQIYPDGYNCGNECLINAINTEVTNEHKDLYPGVADPGAQATLEAVSGTLGHHGPGLRPGGHGRLRQAHRRHGRHPDQGRRLGAHQRRR